LLPNSLSFLLHFGQNLLVPLGFIRITFIPTHSHDFLDLSKNEVIFLPSPYKRLLIDPLLSCPNIDFQSLLRRFYSFLIYSKEKIILLYHLIFLFFQILVSIIWNFWKICDYYFSLIYIYSCYHSLYHQIFKIKFKVELENHQKLNKRN